MTKIHDRLIKNIRSRNFAKFISIAHKDNGEDFFQEVFLPPLDFLFASTFVLFYLFFMYIYLHYTFLIFQIDRYFSTFLVTDMTIEKLQKIATTNVNASFEG
jgi:hypothetical protein